MSGPGRSQALAPESATGTGIPVDDVRQALPGDRNRPLILHADGAWIIVDKPAGLPSVPGRAEGLQDCASARVQAVHGDARVVHRLDMATSGLLLMARGPECQRILSDAFAKRRVDKRYVAVVAGILAQDTGEVDLPLAADWPHRPRQKVDPIHGKPSLTRWQVLSRGADQTRVALMPQTGRSHQLRVHLAALGHPILGDSLYAPPHLVAGTSRLWLHAESLVLAHPITGEIAHFHSAPPF
jgi:tRNA pseudouridine32 synthase / 23S rRNA pseudouridine746 synthase